MRICIIDKCGGKHKGNGLCKKHYDRTQYYKHRKRRLLKNKSPEVRKKINEYHRENNYANFKKYEKTPNGFLMRMYRNMKSRVIGVQKQKHHLYAGKKLIKKESFYKWAKGSEKFYKLFKKWEKSGYKRKLSPSVDRINSKIGYVLSNMEWTTHGENSRRGAVNRWLNNKLPNKK